MADIAKLQRMFDAALKQAGEESSLLLGQSLGLDENDAVNTNKTSFFADSEDAMFVAAVESREEYPGLLYMIFSLRDAILLSSMLLGIPPARISEKRKLAIMENDDLDAFGEIMNQVIGSFNSVLKSGFPQKFHLKLLTPNKFVPGVDELNEEKPIPEGEYVLFRSQLHMDGMEMDRLNIFIPVSLAEMLMPVTQAEEEVLKEEGPSASAPAPLESSEEAASPGAAAPTEDETIIILDDDELDRENVRAFLSGTGLKLVDAPLGEDIKGLFSRGGAKVAVIGVSDADDRELALCIKINALCQESPVPIIMCARSWTRTKVLKALKYGARDIIMKPYSADELMAKVNKFLHAA